MVCAQVRGAGDLKWDARRCAQLGARAMIALGMQMMKGWRGAVRTAALAQHMKPI